MKMKKNWFIFLSLLFATLLPWPAMASPSPFEGRNYHICQDFLVGHTAKVLDVIPAGDGRNNLFIVDVLESYFSWKTLVLKIGMTSGQWRNVKAGDIVPVKMMHTTSDVPLMNTVIEEGFFHSLVGVDGLTYLGFLQVGVRTIRDIRLDRGQIEGEAGPYVFYTLRLWFTNGDELSINTDFIADLTAVASRGDKVLVADGFTQMDHTYQPNPFGNKRVIQKHWLGPQSNEPIYRKPKYAKGFFNLSRGTMPLPGTD